MGAREKKRGRGRLGLPVDLGLGLDLGRPGKGRKRGRGSSWASSVDWIGPREKEGERVMEIFSFSIF
jgi:hypothetical protein